CPSLSDLRPARSTAVMCTNTSRPPSSGLMKPYPRSLLKNLTVPVIAIGKLLSPMLLRRRPPRRGGSAGHSQRGERHRPQGPPSLRRPPKEAERQSQQLGSKPMPRRWKEANGFIISFFPGKPVDARGALRLAAQHFGKRRKQGF